MTFRFEDSKLLFKRIVNGDIKDLEVEHPVKEVALEPVMRQTWSETLFYGVGNTNVAMPKREKYE